MTVQEALDGNFKLNMRHCAGFIDYFKKGFMLPLWCDLALKIGKKGTTRYQYRFSDNQSSLTVHSFEQANNFLDVKEWQHLKINSAWKIFCKSNVDFLLVKPGWEIPLLEHFHYPAGVLNFKDNHALQVNMFAKRQEEDIEIILPFDMPLMHIIPLTERKVVLKFHIVTVNEFMRIDQFPQISFHGAYYTAKKKLRSRLGK